jgi:hypothetical protein
MGILKNMTIKSTAKKRARQLIQIIEDNPETSPIDTLKAYIKSVEYVGGQKLIIEDGDYTTLYELFLFLAMIMVKDELSYDPTMGSREDAELIKQVVDQEVNNWKQRLHIVNS